MRRVPARLLSHGSLLCQHPHRVGVEGRLGYVEGQLAQCPGVTRALIQLLIAERSFLPSWPVKRASLIRSTSWPSRFWSTLSRLKIFGSTPVSDWLVFMIESIALSISSPMPALFACAASESQRAPS